MRYIQYFLLSVSILICGFLFYLSAKQIDLVPFKNNQKENQIMIVEKTNDINYLKSFTEDLIENESETNKVNYIREKMGMEPVVY